MSIDDCDRAMELVGDLLRRVKDEGRDATEADLNALLVALAGPECPTCSDTRKDADGDICFVCFNPDPGEAPQ